MENVTSFDTIGQYNQFNNNDTPHPLVNVIDMAKAAPRSHGKQRYGFYTIFFKEIRCGNLRYGCNYYDYEEGTLVFITELKLKLMPLPPAEIALVCVHCNSIDESLRANLVALQHKPMASELVDRLPQDWIACCHCSKRCGKRHSSTSTAQTSFRW